MEIKVKILAVDEARAGCDVHIFTDAYPEGGKWHVTFYETPLPTGQALIDLIVAKTVGRGDWLELMGKCKTSPPDLTELKALVEAPPLVATVTTTSELAAVVK